MGPGQRRPDAIDENIGLKERVDPRGPAGVPKEGTPPGPYTALADAKAAGAVSINYGVFLNNVISVLIVAFAVFLLI